jgi:dTDP-4-amino-4,6-dideoxygalactose transaminase
VLNTPTRLAIDGGTPIRGPERPLPPVFPRYIPPSAYDNVRAVLDSGFTYDINAKFEVALAEAFGVEHAVTFSNCTAAVHAGLAAFGVGPGDEVVVSSITDYGSVAGILAQQAIPVFPDVDERTGNVTAETIERVLSPRTKAVVAVHFYGLICDLDPIVDLCKSRGVTLVEDCCQAPLGAYKGRMAGSIGDMGCLSFDAEKHLSSDHGGAILTDDPKVAAAARKFGLMRGAVSKPGYGRVHETFGLNYRYGNLVAAVGLAQLEILPGQNRRRVELADGLTAGLAGVQGVHPPYVPPGSSHLYWLYHIRLEPGAFRVGAKEFAAALNAEGLKGCGVAEYYLVPESHTYFQTKSGAFGRSGAPWDNPANAGSAGVSYDLHRLPNARRHLEHTIRWTWTDKYSQQDVDDQTAMIGKVADAYRR